MSKPATASDQQNVNNFLKNLDHPMKPAIDVLRSIILSVNKGITENIKWNEPNFCFHGEDRVTMKIFPPNQIQLIFHLGTGKRPAPKDRLIDDASGLLSWRTNDRALISFTTLTDIESNKAFIIDIVNKWINAAL
jgi:hypothetical protein